MPPRTRLVGYVVAAALLAGCAAPQTNVPPTAANVHAPVNSAYQVTVVLPHAGGIEVARRRRDELQQSLRVDYAVPADTVRWRDLVTMGVSGGMTPCPEAIGILLVAIGLNRVGLGMGLIVAFSLGLASVLSLIGLLLVRSRGLVDDLGPMGRRTQRLLPLGSALVVTALGVGISAKGVLAYLS